MNSPANQTGAPDNIELRLRTMRTLWLAMLMSIVMYYVFTLFAPRPPNGTPNNTIFLVLVCAAVVTALISFPIKNALIKKAIDQQQPAMVQQAYIVAWAVMEVGGLLGILDFYLTGDRYYYVMLIIAACGQLLHAPKREHLVDASFKRRGPSGIWQEPS
jgi:drug/metabolite transporter (DMT)-like permease